MVGAFLVLAALTVEVNGRTWTVGEGASVSGSVVTVRTDGAERKNASVTTEVDLSPYLADGAEWRVRAKGRGVAKPAQPWFGVKAMLTYKDGAGNAVYPGPLTKTGDFGWYTIRYRASFRHGVTGPGKFVLGLQETAGEASFDLASFHLGTAKATRPAVDPAAQCAYSSALAARPRLRGVMSPSRPMSEDDFRKLNSWGVTLLRYQMNRFWSGVDMNRDLADYDRWLDGKLDHLAAVVLPMAEKYGIKVLIDLHMPPGGKAWDGEMNLFHEPYYAQHFVACWQRIARRFKGREAVCGYDLLNEPVQSYNAVGSSDYWALQAEAAKAIRAIDPTTPIYVASCRADSPDAFAELPVLDLKDVVYQTHLYAPMAFTHQGVAKSKPWEPVKWPDELKGWNRDFLRKKLQPVRDFELRHGAKIYVGEFSAVAWAEGADRYLSDCIALFEEYGWDWSYHSYGEFEGWSVEHEAARPYEFKSAESTPRKEVLLRGFQAGEETSVSRPVGRVVQGRPVLVDFGPQGEGGYPAAEIASVSGTGVKLRLSYATHPDGAGERGDFWHATRATYLGKDFDLPIAPASTDRFDVFPVAGAGTVRAAKCQGLVRYVRVAVDTPGATVDVARVVLENRGVHSTEPVVGFFECSDPELTRIWQASARTCQLAAIPSYETPHVTTLPYLSDGAKRDRLVWSGDLWWAQRNMYAAFAPDSPYLPGSLDMLAENQTPLGYINACPYPQSRGPITVENYGPFGSDEFAAWFVPVLADHYLYTGDRALLERRYPNAVRVMDYLASHQDADGLFVQRPETAKHSEGLAVGGKPECKATQHETR